MGSTHIPNGSWDVEKNAPSPAFLIRIDTTNGTIGHTPSVLSALMVIPMLRHDGANLVTKLPKPENKRLKIASSIEPCLLTGRWRQSALCSGMKKGGTDDGKVSAASAELASRIEPANSLLCELVESISFASM